MLDRQRQGAARPAVIAGAAFLVLILVIALSIGPDDAVDAPSPIAPTEPAAPTGEGASPAPSAGAVDPRSGPLRVESGGTIEIAWEDLTGDAPVQFDLTVPEGVQAKSVRIVTPSVEGRPLEPGATGDAGVRLDVPVEWLREPGRYIVEVRTNERVALPLRRFAITVR